MGKLFGGKGAPPTMNISSNDLLIHSQNIPALEWLLADLNLAAKIDLVYIDPPFATNNDFVINSNRVATISSGKAGKVAYSDKIVGQEFIDFLRARMILIKELLSDQGSVYVHTDYKVGHYVKVMMDEVFGAHNFRNDITRIKCNPKNFSRIGYGNVKDMVLFYSKGAKPIWNEQYVAYSPEELVKLFPKIDGNGRRYTTTPIHAPGETVNGDSAKKFRDLDPPPGRHWRVSVEKLEQWDEQGLIEWSANGNPRKKIYADESPGKKLQDIWSFKDPQYPVYPTEKNLSLIELIIRASSKPGSTVLDCFCGSGTSLVAAYQQQRNWIGIDASASAISAAKRKLQAAQMPLMAHQPIYKFIQLDGESPHRKNPADQVRCLQEA